MKTIFRFSIFFLTLIIISGSSWAAVLELYSYTADIGETDAVERAEFPMVMIDVRDQVTANPAHTINVNDLLAWEAQHGRIPKGSIVLLYTGWKEEWNIPDAFAEGGYRYPTCDGSVTPFLLRERGVAGLGIDREHHFISEEGQESDAIFTWLFAGIVLENLTNLDPLPPTGAKVQIAVLPEQEKGSGKAVVSVKAIIPKQ